MSGIVGTSHSKSKVIGRSPDTILGWCHINGTGTIAIRDSYNMGSVTDFQEGGYDFNFLKDLVAHKYIGLVTVDANNKGAVNNKLATNMRVLTRDEADTYHDCGYVDVVILTN